MKTQRVWAIILLLGCLQGCHHPRSDNRHSLKATHNHFAAKRAWLRTESHYANTTNAHHIAKGFQDGYYDVASGGPGSPPRMPASRYWHSHYRGPEGQQKVAAWYSGFSHGAQVALNEMPATPSGTIVPVEHTSPPHISPEKSLLDNEPMEFEGGPPGSVDEPTSRPDSSQWYRSTPPRQTPSVPKPVAPRPDFIEDGDLSRPLPAPKDRNRRPPLPQLEDVKRNSPRTLFPSSGSFKSDDANGRRVSRTDGPRDSRTPRGRSVQTPHRPTTWKAAREVARQKVAQRRSTAKSSRLATQRHVPNSPSRQLASRSRNVAGRKPRLNGPRNGRQRVYLASSRLVKTRVRAERLIRTKKDSPTDRIGQEAVSNAVSTTVAPPAKAPASPTATSGDQQLPIIQPARRKSSRRPMVP